MLIEYAFSVKEQKYFYFVKNTNKNEKEKSAKIYMYVLRIICLVVRVKQISCKV